MHVISRKKLKEFWDRHPESESSLRAWYRITRRATWTSFPSLRATFPSADRYERCIIFDISGNRFRLIAAVHFNRARVFVRHVLTHREYDRDKWKKECKS